MPLHGCLITVFSNIKGYCALRTFSSKVTAWPHLGSRWVLCKMKGAGGKPRNWVQHIPDSWIPGQKTKHPSSMLVAVHAWANHMPSVSLMIPAHGDVLLVCQATTTSAQHMWTLMKSCSGYCTVSLTNEGHIRTLAVIGIQGRTDP